MAEEFQSGVCSGRWWNSIRTTGLEVPVSAPVSSVTRSVGMEEMSGFGWAPTGNKQRSCDESSGASVSGSSVSFQFDAQKAMTAASLPMVTSAFLMDPSLPLTGFALSSPSDWNQPLLSSTGGRGNDQSSSFHGMLNDELSSKPYFNVPEAKAAIESNQIQMGSTVVENTTPNLFKDTNYQGFMVADQHHLSSGNESGESVSFPENLSASYGSPSPVFLQGLVLDQHADLRPQQPAYDNINSSYPLGSSDMVMNLHPTWSKIPQFSNNTPFWNAPMQTQFLPHNNFEGKPNTSSITTKPSSEGVRDSSSVTKKGSGEPAFKKPRVETPSPLPTFKVRKEKLSDRVTALQQLVSPFGKTDTASVLYEAIEYIKFLHDQVNFLSTPYLKNGHPLQHQQNSDKSRDGEAPKPDLRSRGLCLVPITSTFPVANEPISDFWTPSCGGYYR